MEMSRRYCRLCISETEFSVSLFGSYSHKTNLIHKILVCLKVVIEENDFITTICHKCTENVERYYDFNMFIKKAQTKLVKPRREVENTINRRVISPNLHENIDADYTFSFLEVTNNEEKNKQKVSSPFFSHSPPNVLIKRTGDESWKTPKPVIRPDNKVKRFHGTEWPEHHSRESVGKIPKPVLRPDNKVKRSRVTEWPKNHSRDLFESQSQDMDESDLTFRTIDWKLTPDDNIIKRVRDKCFGRS